MAELIQFKRPDGQAVKGWLASAKQPLGAVVVIQEWWGLNDQIRGVAQRFADAGFTALVPDLYRGKSTVEAEEAHHLMTGLNFGDAASQDVRGAVQYLKALKAGSGKVGGHRLLHGRRAHRPRVDDGAPRPDAAVSLVRLPAARLCGRLEDQAADAGALGDPGRGVRDRRRRRA